MNIYNVLVMTADFNIRNSSWNLLFSFHSSHSDLLSDIADSLDLLLSNPTNQVPTGYSDNTNDANSVIDLMFLRPNFSEIDNHTIHPKLQYSLDHASLTADISIIKKFVLNKWYAIIKNSKEEDKFIIELIDAIKKINTEWLMNKESLKLAVQEFANKSDIIWYEHLKYVNITKHSKA